MMVMMMMMVIRMMIRMVLVMMIRMMMMMIMIMMILSGVFVHSLNDYSDKFVTIIFIQRNASFISTLLTDFFCTIVDLYLHSIWPLVIFMMYVIEIWWIDTHFSSM